MIFAFQECTMTDSKHSKPQNFPKSSSTNEALASEESASKEVHSKEDSNSTSRLPVRSLNRKQTIRPFNTKAKSQASESNEDQKKASHEVQVSDSNKTSPMVVPSSLKSGTRKKDTPDDLKRMALRSPFAEQAGAEKQESEVSSVSSKGKMSPKMLSEAEASSLEEILSSSADEIFSPSELDSSDFDFLDESAQASANPSISAFSKSSPRNQSKPAALLLPFGKANSKKPSSPDNSQQSSSNAASEQAGTSNPPPFAKSSLRNLSSPQNSLLPPPTPASDPSASANPSAFAKSSPRNTSNPGGSVFPFSKAQANQPPKNRVQSPVSQPPLPVLDDGNLSSSSDVFSEQPQGETPIFGDVNQAIKPRPEDYPSSVEDGENVDNTLPEDWLSGKTGATILPTHFSNPKLFSDLDEDDEPLDGDLIDNTGLEKDENLPEDLQSIIDGYDDEIRSATTRDGVRECTIQLAIARILEHTGHEKLAYVRYLKALKANHFSRTAIHELRRIARAYNKMRDVTTLLQSEIDTNISAFEQSALLEECALITYFVHGEQYEEAANMLYRAIALTPQNPSPVYSLAYILLFEGKFEECCNTLEHLIPLTDDVAMQSALNCIKGDIETSLRPSHSAGLSHYLRALDVEPASLYAYQHIMSILIRLEDWQSIYKRSIDFVDASKDKALSHSMLLLAGSIAMDCLADITSSNKAYERAYKLVGSDKIPLELELDNYADDSAKWQFYDEVIAKLIEVNENPKDQRTLILMQAINRDINGKSPSAALEVLTPVVQDMTQDRLILEYYLTLLKRDGRIDETMRFSRRIANISNTEEAATRYASLGCYYYDVLKKLEEAEQNFRSALALDPNQRTAFDYLESILRARNDYEGVAAIYRARLDIVLDARMRASILYTLACIYDYSLMQPENAISYYKQYREIFPDDIHAISSLQRLAQKTKNWKFLIEMLLIEKNTSTSPTERCSVLLRIANICRYKLNKPQYATAFLYQAKEENPKAIAVYRELLDVLREMKSWKEVIAVLKELLVIEKKNEDKIQTLFDMATIQEQVLCDTNAAVACYEQILTLAPDNELIWTKLANIYRRTGNLAAFYELSMDKAQRIPQPKIRARYFFKVALKALTLFKEPKQAISILEMAVSNDPNYMPSVFLLTMLYGTTVQLEKLVTLIQDFATNPLTQSTKSACSLTVAYLYLWQLKNYDEAIHPLELSLALSPDAISARFMLIYAQYVRGQFTELAPLFAEGAQNSNDKALAIHDYNLAALFAHTYSNAPGAFENEVSSLKASLAIDPDDIIANERLEAMEPLRANLVPFIEKRLKNSALEDKTELQLALVESIYPDSPQKAFSMICDVIEENPTHLPALRVAANMAQKLGNPTLLCRFLALQAQNLENNTTRIVAWSSAADIAQNQLKKTDMAIEYAKQAFLIAPQRLDLYDRLLELLKVKHDIAAIDNIMQLHTRSISKENQVMRYIEMAEDYLNEFNEPVQAAIKLRQVLEIDHENTEVLWKLAQIEISLQHWNEAKNALEILIETENVDPDILSNARKALANLYVEHLGTSKLAVPMLQDMLSNNPDDVEALENLAQVYFEDSRFTEALAMLMRLNKLIQPPQNIRILIQMANIYKALNEPDNLTKIMREATELVNLNPNILYELQPWIERFNDPVILRSFIERLLELNDLPINVQVDIYQFVAFCYAGPLHMRFEADKFAVAAADLDPGSLKTQLLAARVFDPKEAMVHASAAASIAPFNIEPYQAMHNIAVNSNRHDLQARVEQQLALLTPSFKPDAELQNSYVNKHPDRPGCITDSVLQFVESPNFNRNIQALLKLVGAKAQIFELPLYATTDIPHTTHIGGIFKEIRRAFELTDIAPVFVRDAPFVYSTNEEQDLILLNEDIFANASDGEIRFHIASALTHVKLGTLPLVILPPNNVVMLISGLLGLVDPQLTKPDILARIKSFIPRNLRKSVVDLIMSQGLGAYQYDPKQIQYAAAWLDTQIAHLFSGSLASSVAALIHRKSPQIILPNNTQQWMIHYANTPFVTALFEYNTSEKFTELRQRTGLFLKMNG